MYPTPTRQAPADHAQVTDRRSLFGDEQRIALREYENPGLFPFHEPNAELVPLRDS